MWLWVCDGVVAYGCVGCLEGGVVCFCGGCDV